MINWQLYKERKSFAKNIFIKKNMFDVGSVKYHILQVCHNVHFQIQIHAFFFLIPFSLVVAVTVIMTKRTHGLQGLVLVGKKMMSAGIELASPPPISIPCHEVSQSETPVVLDSMKEQIRQTCTYNVTATA